jgi:aryl-alcohol dehydrogenase-like predicted oxidoreductase
MIFTNYIYNMKTAPYNDIKKELSNITYTCQADWDINVLYDELEKNIINECVDLILDYVLYSSPIWKILTMEINGDEPYQYRFEDYQLNSSRPEKWDGQVNFMRRLHNIESQLKMVKRLVMYVILYWVHRNIFSVIKMVKWK